MPYLLNLVYLALLVVFSPWLIYSAIRKKKYREGFAAKVLGHVPVRQGDGPCLWLHAVSVGEVNVLEPLLVRLEERHPGWTFVISTTTKTGFDLARKKYAPRCVFYCPLDFSWAVKSALKRIRPDVLVLAELELWPNLIRTSRKQGVRTAIINGRLSEHSARGYERVYPLISSVLRSIDLLAVQNEEYATRFRQIGGLPESLHITGSIKFDGAETNRDNVKTRSLATLAGITEDDLVLLAGSTQEPEEELALAAFCRLADEHPHLRLILTPRHPDRFPAVANLLDQSGAAWVRRSELVEGRSDSATRVLLVDAVGELAAWWGVAHIAYVGGSMGKRGGQNMIEPAAYGAAVSFGPNTDNFRDVVEMMLDRQAAVVVNNGEQLTAFVERCLNDPTFVRDLGQRAQSLVFEQLGAASRTCDLLHALMVERESSSTT